MTITYISYTIDTTCTSDNETENQLYAEAVSEAIKSEFPTAAVFVELGASIPERCRADVESDGDDLIEIDDAVSRLNEIANEVWDRADYV